MSREGMSKQMEAVRAYSLADLLECPLAIKRLLSNAVRPISFDSGEVIFRQSEPCRGLYVVVAGQFTRRTDCCETRLSLSPVRAGDAVELAAILGNGCHVYTLTAQTAGSVLLLPTETLHLAFQKYPPLRMRLLEELAREVSRAYNLFCCNRVPGLRRKSSAA
jgi:CRP-like cAMP-binding protein